MKKLGTMQMALAMAMAAATMGKRGIAAISTPKIRTRNPSPIVCKLIGICPGGRHAWYESAIGHIRKPYNGVTA